STIHFPTNQHGVVFMHGVVAVLHEHPAPIAELHGQSHASTRTQTIDVFAALFPCRDIAGAAIAGQDLAFFKVDVDWVIPSAATVPECPDFASAIFRSCRNASEAGIQHLAVIGLHAPGTDERSVRIIDGL